MPLQKLANEQGYLKAGFLGFPKSGKTFTSVKLAIGTIKLFKLDGPVALFDTESGSNYVADMIKSETGKDLLGVRARSFNALMQFAKDCITVADQIWLGVPFGEGFDHLLGGPFGARMFRDSEMKYFPPLML